MRKGIFTTLIVLITAFSFAACERITSSSSTNSTNSSAMSDSDLQRMVKTKLESDPAVKAADLSVSANAGRNEVELSGTVDSEALRTRAVELAKTAHAGLMVTDRIDVKAREMTRAQYSDEDARKERAKAQTDKETVGNSIDDAGIEAKIVGKLIGNSRTPERKINVDVVNSVVTLRGSVETPDQKAEAERVARSTDGVKKVDNLLKVERSKTKS